jgi:hypothetical protein
MIEFFTELAELADLAPILESGCSDTLAPYGVGTSC